MKKKPRIEIERVAYQEFLSHWQAGKYLYLRLGQAFYNHFKLHKMSDQAQLRNLYELDGDAANKVISEVFKIQ